MTRYWGVRVGSGSKYAGEAHRGGFVAIEWHELGDLAWLAAEKDDDRAAAQLRELYHANYKVTGTQAAIGAGQVRRFVREIQAGDIVFLPDTPRRRVYIGRVKGDFVEVEAPKDGCPYRRRRMIDWLKAVPRDQIPQPLLSSLGSLTTVFSLGRRSAYAQAVVEGLPSPGAGRNVTSDVLEHVVRRLHGLHPKEFEAFVAAYFEAIGYQAEATPYVGDGGIDVAGVLDAEGLAQLLLRVQVKRTKTNVGIDTVLKTRGALGPDEQGAIITLGGFTKKAQENAEAQGLKTISLVGGEQFAEMILEHWKELPAEARKLLEVRPREASIRERFVVVPPDTV